MIKRVMVCGVDCHKDDENCNGYCVGMADEPPAATERQQRESAKYEAHRALDAAEKAWHEYAALCDVGTERTGAFAIFENVRLARRI